ncbi:MAG TPA: phosphodiester glycosidase family protein [Caulobacteraceae bacterium]|jgi:hypothetical protein
MKPVLLILWISVAFANVTQAKVALTNSAPRTYTIRVSAPGVQYITRAWVYPVGQVYKASIYAIGVSLGSKGRSVATAPTFSDVVSREPKSLVINGGFYENDPSTPAGLLLVAGYIVHSYSLEKSADGTFKLSQIICQNGAQRLSIIPTQEIANNPASILSRCQSAVQTGPGIVAAGKNGIRPTELFSRAGAARTILAFDRAGGAYVVVFTLPVHLYVAAEFIRGAPNGSSQVTVVGNSTAVTASGGLGLDAAVNLDGDVDSTCYLAGQRVAGDRRQLLPSAIAIAR